MIDERHVRDMLERRAGTISATPADEPKAIRRARRRLALNATVGGLVGLVLVAGALVGLQAIQATPTPVEPATPPPSLAGMGSLAYVVDGDIYVADGDGSNPVRIVDGRPPNECSGHPENWAEGPIWSPDGRYLAYRHADCATEDWHGNVSISDPEGSAVTSFPTGTGWEIAWSPDSTRVAVWAEFGETIGVYGLDGEQLALLTTSELDLGGDYDPMWLPDGESLLVQDEWVVPVDGSAPYRLPGVGGRTARVTYSPDGSRVAYGASRSLVVAEADGSNHQVVFGDWPWSPVWSPTGDRIAFTSQSGRGRPWQLRVLDVATGRVTLLAEADGLDEVEVIDFSPEGDRILFSKKDWRIDAFSLWSVDADGSDLRRLVTGTPWGDWLSPGPTP
jgi:Tol biopolymer transport system component